MKNLRKKLAAFVDLPESAFGGCSYIEIESNSCVKINGCGEIIDYSGEKVILSSSEFDILIIGHGLTLMSYGSNTAMVKGQICSVSFGEGEAPC